MKLQDLENAMTEASRRERLLMVRNLKGARAQLLRAAHTADEQDLRQTHYACMLAASAVDDALAEEL